MSRPGLHAPGAATAGDPSVSSAPRPQAVSVGRGGAGAAGTLHRIAGSSQEDGSGRSAASFCKFAGGKRKLVPFLLDLPPVRAFLRAGRGTYHEPFVGGGALFWALANLRSGVLSTALAPRWAILGDTNPELTNAYLTVRDSVEALIVQLEDSQRRYRDAEKASRFFARSFYYSIRDNIDVEAASPVERAARFLFLNRLCFNGLFRVNKTGHFNVPFGDYENPLICDVDNLRACSVALRGIEIHERPFERVLHDARPGDLVFADPPYLPLSKTSSFTAYAKEGFTLTDHERLRDVALDLKRRGVHVVISNSAAPEIVDLYSNEEDFTIHRVRAARAINSKKAGRGKIEELVIT